ncbi:MAG: hypothetical protein D6824_04245 [Planctomycetota bacterium]|nr:MAG: hypothetical protein D6824_04245 [Planctomycetota bacterium]
MLRLLGALALAALGGCAAGPVVTVRNRTAAPVAVAFWVSERVGGYEQTWKNMQGQSDRVDPGRSANFRLSAYRDAADPVLRMQVVTRGPSWEPAYNYWFEVVTSPPLTITLTGPLDKIEASASRGLVAPIPWARVPAERRAATLTPSPPPPAADAKTPRTPKGSR